MSAAFQELVKPWEVRLVKWIHPDYGYTYRPMIVVRVVDDGVIGIKVTTSAKKSYPGDYWVEQWAEAGLDRPSIARTSQIKHVSFKHFAEQEPFGTLSEHDAAEIRRLIESAEQDR